MGRAALIQHLDTLIKLHASLLKLADQKTDTIKNSDIAKLENLMNEEQKYIKAINQIENERQKAVAQLMGQPEASLLDVVENAEGPEKEQLSKQRDQLLALTKQLKEANQLNQQLIYTSLQFVNLSLDMLRPRETDFNYQKPAKAGSQQQKRSMFDSKA
ncbi:flagellar protein FlgN [Bacillus sp. 1P06AnD]|uniref:flagellar protein FlgN n=1 Tax=Bacillus sp. 1P06AnD TaxID=3132208 RepID=UPI0039A09D3B